MTPVPPDEQALFEVARKIDSPEAREAYLRQACDGAATERRVRALLRAYEESASFLEPPAAALPGTTDEPSHEPRGAVIGPYKLLEQIGEGGMGTVWMAQQTQPVKRLVAVKLIKAGMDSKQVIARFEAERQALALMDHPNIAKVLDGGQTPPAYAGGSPRPYFVMDLVKGVPITRYCDEHRLTPRQRLELFLPVCAAVQHAHHKGIIHRDLKPSNVLVALYDGKPVPKVIDFGVAKAAGQTLGDKTLVTGFGAIVGTLEYMSPEQAEINQLDIDTRSDIYSLGVLLYELLAGSPPFSRTELEKGDLLEMLRVIREQEPTRPSTKLSTADGLPTLAANRGTEPAKLTRLVRGELDWIVMKALEKDRSRRYETANGFAMDVQRYLADEPVQACPPSVVYRLKKFLRRHKGPAVAAALVVLTLVGGIAAASWQAVRATRAEAAEAKHRQLAEENEQAARQAAETAKKAKETAQDERNKAVEAEQKTATALEREQFTSYAHRIALAHREWLANEVGRARQLLEECPIDLRDWEWHYLRRLCNTELVAFHGHATEATALAFSPDGSRVASISKMEARVWDSASGKEIFKIAGRAGVGVAFSRDSKFLAVAWPQCVTIHDATDGSELLRIVPDHQPANITGVDFSADGLKVATTGCIAKVGGPPRHASPAIFLWDVKTGKELQRFTDLPGWANRVAFSPDGTRLAASSAGVGGELPEPGQVRVWDVTSGKLLRTLRPHDPDKIHPGTDTFFVTDVAFSADGKRLASSGSDGTVRIWELSTGREALAVRGHNGWVNCVAFSPQGEHLASAGGDRVVRVWDAATGRELNSIRGHTRPVDDLAFSPDGRRLASAAGEVRVWEAGVDQQSRTFLRDPAAAGVYSAAFSPDGKRLASASMQEVKVHEVATGRELPPAAQIRTGAMSPPGPLVRFSPDGTTLATTGMEGVKLWGPATGGLVRFFPDQEPADQKWILVTVGLALSPDGRRLATVGNGLLTVWETAMARVIHKIRTPADSVAFSPNGRRIATATPYTWKIDTVNGRRREVKGPGEIKVWDAESGEELMRIADGGKGVAFSPDGTRLAAGQPDGTATVWDADRGEVLFTCRGHSGPVNSLAFSRDGRRLATAGADHTVKIWDTRLGREVFALRGHGDPVVSVAFSPDGKHLASASPDKPSQVKLWNAGPPGPSLLPPLPPAEQKARPAIIPAGPVLSPRIQAEPMPAPKPRPAISAANADRVRPIAELEKHVYRIVPGPGRGELTLYGLEPTRAKSFEIVDDVSFRPTRTMKDPFRPAEFAASKDGRLVAWCEANDTRVIVQEVAGGKAIEIDTEYAGPSIAFSPDGKLVATGGDGSRVKLWETATGRSVGALDTGGRGVRRPAFSPDGKLLAASHVNGPTHLFEVESGKLLHSLVRRQAHEIAFSPDGKLLAVAYVDGSVALWDAANGQLLRFEATGARQVFSLDWNPKGDVLVTAGQEGKIVLWEPRKLTGLKELDAPGLVIQVRFTSDGSRLLTSGGTLGVGPQNRKVVIWGVANGDEK